MVSKYVRDMCAFCSFLCGDFNFVVSPTDRVRSNGSHSAIDDSALVGAWASRLAQFTEASQPDCTFRAFAHADSGPMYTRLDRIFISADYSSLSAFSVQAWLVGDRIGDHIPSDHIAVCASFSLARANPAPSTIPSWACKQDDFINIVATRCERIQRLCDWAIVAEYKLIAHASYSELLRNATRKNFKDKQGQHYLCVSIIRSHNRGDDLDVCRLVALYPSDTCPLPFNGPLRAAGLTAAQVDQVRNSANTLLLVSSQEEIAENKDLLDGPAPCYF